MPFHRPRLLICICILAIASPDAARAEWYTGERAVMGTRITVELWGEDQTEAVRNIERVMQEMQRVDALMSTYKPTSQVSLVNADAAKRPITVDADLFGLLQTSLEYSQLTEGAFDITYASVGHLYDFKRHVKPTEAEIKAALPAVNYRHVILDPAARTVRFSQQGVRIDL